MRQAGSQVVERREDDDTAALARDYTLCACRLPDPG
jgi:hypothetical protein